MTNSTQKLALVTGGRVDRRLVPLSGRGEPAVRAAERAVAAATGGWAR